MILSKFLKYKYSLKRFIGASQGNAATEFALILPIMITLFFGILEGGELMATERRVDRAATAIVDLVAQSATITPSELQHLRNGIEYIIDTDNVPNLEFKFTSVIVSPDDADVAIVHWSRDQDLNEPYAAGSVFTGIDDMSILKANLSFLIVELSYEYDGAISSQVFNSPMTLRSKASRLPRLSARVQLCNDHNPDDCTS